MNNATFNSKPAAVTVWRCLGRKRSTKLPGGSTAFRAVAIQ